MSKWKLAAVLLVGGLVAGSALATSQTKKFREGGGSGFVNVTFDDTYITFSPADDTSHGTETSGIIADTGKCALIAVKDLFTQIPATSGGRNIQISNAKLHLFRSSGSSSTTVAINRLTTNWLPGSAGTNENDVSGQHADKSADVHWAGGNFSTSDYDTSVVTTGAWGSGSNQELIYTVTSQVAGIYSAGVNYGLVVRANAAIAGRASEYSTSSRRPQLEVTYDYPPAGYALTVNSGTGGGTYSQGTVVNISGDAPASGKAFDKWVGDTSGIANANASSTTLTMPAAAQTVTATYVNVYLLTVNSGTGGGSYKQGVVVNISADAAASGLVFDKWVGDTSGIANVNAASTTLTMPAANQTVTATYKAAPSQQTIMFREGGGTGYTDVTFDDTFIVYNPADNTTHGTQDFDGVQCSSSQVTLIAVKDLFTQLPKTTGGYQIQINQAKLHLFRYNSGTSSNVISVYRLTTNWLPGSAGTNENNVSGQHAVVSTSTTWASGNFSSGDYASSPCNTGNWVDNYNQECQLTVTDVVAEMYDTSTNYGIVLFANGTISGRASEHSTYRPILEIAYQYGGGAAQYTLTVNSGTGSGSYTEGAVVNISADAPPSGKVFDKWTGNTSGIANVNASSTTLTMPAANQTITATYVTGTTYTLTVNSGSGDGNYTQGTVVNISADSPPSGKTFDKWTGNTSGIANVNASSTTLTMPAAAQTITATYVDVGSGPSVSGVSGTISQGSTITISGSNFGSGPDSVVFDDFELGTNGNTIMTGSGSARVGQWDSTSGLVHYTNSHVMSGSLSFEADMSTTWLNYVLRNLPSGTSQVFASCWVYIPAVIPGDGNPDGTNWKHVWIQGSSSTDDDIFFQFTNTQYYVSGNCGTVNGYSSYTRTDDFQAGDWIRWEFYVKGGLTDGHYDWDLLHGRTAEKESVNKDGQTWGGSSPYQYESIRFNGYGRQTSNCYPIHDDCYSACGANCRARVEIGNASTYANCTRLAICGPTSWSGTSITAKCNIGGLSGSGWYLFVIDANKNVSSGYQVN